MSIGRDRIVLYKHSASPSLLTSNNRGRTWLHKQSTSTISMPNKRGHSGLYRHSASPPLFTSNNCGRIWLYKQSASPISMPNKRDHFGLYKHSASPSLLTFDNCGRIVHYKHSASPSPITSINRGRTGFHKQSASPLFMPNSRGRLVLLGTQLRHRYSRPTTVAVLAFTSIQRHPMPNNGSNQRHRSNNC